VAEPIPFMVTRYRCPTCPRTGSSKSRIAEHHGRCWMNPEARGCKTCKHYDKDHEGGDHCDLGIDLRRFEETWEGEWPEKSVMVPMPNGATLPIVHCEKWEAADV